MRIPTSVGIFLTRTKIMNLLLRTKGSNSWLVLDSASKLNKNYVYLQNLSISEIVCAEQKDGLNRHSSCLPNMHACPLTRRYLCCLYTLTIISTIIDVCFLSLSIRKSHVSLCIHLIIVSITIARRLDNMCVCVYVTAGRFMEEINQILHI